MRTAAARPGIWGRIEDRMEAAPAGDGARVDLWSRLAELVDPAQLRPKLADDIEIREFHHRWGEDYIMVGNPRDLIHYRLDKSDLELLRLMDGTRTVKEIVLERLRESGDLELSTVADLVRQLYAGNFLDRRFSDVNGMVKRAMNPQSLFRRKASHFARTLSIEWSDADGLVRWLYDHGLKWFFNRVVALASLALALAGVVAFAFLVESERYSLTGESLVLGFLVLIVLDYFMVFVHELGHALVLTHNGRRVKSAGFMIYFGAPAFFVDSSDGLMMGRRQEILASLAGPHAQMIVAAISSLVALAIPEWFLSETLYRYAVLNYFVIFMNLIPLLELDGYFILSDFLEIPDLRPRSLSFLQHGLWNKLGKRERLSRRELWLTLYAVIGVAFTVFSFYTAYFYWQTVFGGLVARLWNGGTITRLLLVALAVFVAGPLVRGAINLVRSVLRRLRQAWRRVRFRLERGWRVEAARLIDGLPLFDDVPAEVLSDLAGRVRLRSLSPGQPAVRQGDRADAFYVVRRGTLQVVEEDSETGRERVLRTLGRGEAFGELGLLVGRRRAATVRATSESEVFEIDKGTFERLLADMVHMPDFAPTLQQVGELRALPCFSHLEPDELSELLQHGRWMNIPPGEEILSQGAVGEAFYAMASGQVDVERDGEVVRALGPGSYFGEVALLLDVPRTATVRSRTPVRAYRLEREGFDGLVAASFRRGTLNPHVAIDRMAQH
jgi:putative peptide zinc metalloprotease protein